MNRNNQNTHIMKKIYTIGRDPQCDIVIQDVTDIVSRVHAVLRVEPNGKLYIKDQSKNGTYINGMRMTPNVEIPVSRKDNVSFANIRDMDWSIVPNPMMKTVSIISFTALGLAVAGLLTWLIIDQPNFVGKNKGDKLVIDTLFVKDTVVKTDTVEKVVTVKVKEEIPKEEPDEKLVEEPKETGGTEVSL